MWCRHRIEGDYWSAFDFKIGGAAGEEFYTQAINENV
jgi:hypothetical protein